MQMSQSPKKRKKECKMMKLGTGHGERIVMGGNLMALVIYFLVLVLYTLGGAAVFMHLEGENDRQYMHNLATKCNAVVEKEKWTHWDQVNNSRDMVENSLNSILDCLRDKGVVHYPMYEYETAMVYVISTYTTMGYGNVNTKSELGRVICILYTILGIPIFFAFYIDGIQAFRFSLNALSYKFGMVSRLKSEAVPRMILPHKYTEHKRKSRRLTLAVTMGLFLNYMLCMGVITKALFMPEWDLLVCIYFIFQSLSLVGYGDTMPSEPWQVVVLTLPILIGTVFYGVIVLILQEEIQRLVIAIVVKCPELNDDFRDVLTDSKTLNTSC